jgi:hypothetical protein
MMKRDRSKAFISLLCLAAIASLAFVACASAPQPTSTPSAAKPSISPSPQDEAPSTGTPGSAVSPTPRPPAKQTAPAAASPTPGTPTVKQNECPKLESRLYGLTAATDQVAYASANELYFANGRTRVVIELQQTDTALPSGYDIIVESRQGQLVQALVLVSDLCRMSNEPQVRFVRAPIQSVR